MYRGATRTNVADLLWGAGASMAVAILVLVGGAAIGEANTGPELVATSAVTATEVRFDPTEHDEIRTSSFLCCALIYADSSADQ